MDTKLYDAIFPELSARASSHGFNCIGLELVTEDGENILRLYLDSENGVDLLNCETVSRDASEYLDTVGDLLPVHYYLEVTSPGLERPLFCKQDFIDNIGQLIQATLTNGKIIEGKVIEADDVAVKMLQNSTFQDYTYDKIKTAHLVFVMNKGEKKTFKKNNKKKK